MTVSPARLARFGKPCRVQRVGAAVHEAVRGDAFSAAPELNSLADACVAISPTELGQDVRLLAVPALAHEHSLARNINWEGGELSATGAGQDAQPQTTAHREDGETRCEPFKTTDMIAWRLQCLFVFTISPVLEHWTSLSSAFLLPLFGGEGLSVSSSLDANRVDPSLFLSSSSSF